MSIHMKATIPKYIYRIYDEGIAKVDSFSGYRAFERSLSERILRYRDNAARTVSLVLWKRRIELINYLAAMITISFFLVPRVQAWKSGSLFLFGFDVENSCQMFEGIETNTSDEQVIKRAENLLPYVLRYVEANYEQQDVLRSLLEKAIPDIIFLYRKGHLLRQQLFQTLLNKRADHENLRQLLQEITSHNERTSDYIVQLMTAVSGILAREQRIKMLECVTSETWTPE